MAAQPVDVSRSRYDLSTFTGRWRHFVSVTSPLTLFESRASLKDAQQLLVDYQAGRRPDLLGQDEVVWKAKQLVDSSIHPDTGEPVPLPFRMSAFVPTNLVIVAGMLMPNPSLRSVVFWQWANQTLNVAVNFSNANKSVPMSTSEVATAYLAATGSSVGIALGLTRAVPRLRGLSPAVKTLLSRFIPFASVASAGCVNMACMRWKEIRDGIDVFPPASDSDDQGDADADKPVSLGKSPHAGTLAVAQTAASRVMTNIPTLILPPILMTVLERRGAFAGPRGRPLQTVANLGLIGSALLVFLPPAIAVFPQRGTVQTSSLERQFQGVKDPRTGAVLTELEFNKGL